MTRYDFYSNYDSSGLSIVCKEGKLGVFNVYSQKELLNPIYDDIEILDDNCFAVKQDGLWGVVSKHHKILADIEYTYVANFNKDFILISNSEGLSLVAKTGMNYLNGFYESIYLFENGFAIVEKNENFGVIDDDLNEVIPTKYDYIEYYKDNLFFARNGDSVVIIDSNDELVYTTEFESIEKITAAPYFIVRKNDLYSVVNKNLKPTKIKDYPYIHHLHSCFFRIIGDNFKEGIAHVTKGTIVEPMYRNISSLENNLFQVENKLLKSAIFNTNGDQITDFKYSQLYLAGNAIVIIVINNTKELFGLMDKTGEVKIEPIYDCICPLNSGFVVYKDGKYGICDSNLILVTDIIYDKINCINEGPTKIGKNVAEVVYNGMVGTIFW